MFSSRNTKNVYIIIWILFLARSQDKKIEISYLSSGKWDKLDKSAWYIHSPEQLQILPNIKDKLLHKIQVYLGGLLKEEYLTKILGYSDIYTGSKMDSSNFRTSGMRT